MTDIFPLDRPVASLDLETTGVHAKFDRIVQIGVVKIYPDGRTTEWDSLINPTISIPREATACHGITDELVKDAPTFRDLASKIFKGLENTDIAGYNVSFDIRFLIEEFARLRIEYVAGRILDGFRIFQRHYPRNLAAAVAEYLKDREEFRNFEEKSHDALEDAKAALAVLEAQLLRHTELPRSVAELHKMFFDTPKENVVDPDGKLAWRNGEVALNFGANAGMLLRNTPRNYLEWIAGPRSTFSPLVKQIVADAIAGKFQTRQE